MGKLRAFFSKQDQQKLEEGLANTKKSFLSKLGTALVGKTKVDEDVLDELEDVLIQSDVGVATTIKIIEALEARIAKDKYLGQEDLMRMMQEEIMNLLVSPDTEATTVEEELTKHQPYVVMVVGVNGVGKTTTVGKLAHQFKSSGKK
jgi:fused signal recognition particle receptor